MAQYGTLHPVARTSPVPAVIEGALPTIFTTIETCKCLATNTARALSPHQEPPGKLPMPRTVHRKHLPGVGIYSCSLLDVCILVSVLDLLATLQQARQQEVVLAAGTDLATDRRQQEEGTLSPKSLYQKNKVAREQLSLQLLMHLNGEQMASIKASSLDGDHRLRGCNMLVTWNPRIHSSEWYSTTVLL